MEQYSIIGAAGDTEYVEGELLGDQLIAMFPKISFVKDMRHPCEWADYRRTETQKRGFQIPGAYPVVFRRDGRLVGKTGSVEDFKNECKDMYGLELPPNPEMVAQVAAENMEFAEDEARSDKWKPACGRFKKIWSSGVSFEGMWRNHTPHRGTITYTDGSSFEGTLRDGVAHGQGVFRYADGAKFVGMFAMGKRMGMGKFVDDENVYDGYYKDDKCHGKGLRTYKGGRTYSGDWEYNDATGKGVEIKPIPGSNTDCDKYDGEYIKGQRHGWGRMWYATGDVYEGEWEEGSREGFGEFDFFLPQPVVPDTDEEPIEEGAEPAPAAKSIIQTMRYTGDFKQDRPVVGRLAFNDGLTCPIPGEIDVAREPVALPPGENDALPPGENAVGEGEAVSTAKVPWVAALRQDAETWEVGARQRVRRAALPEFDPDYPIEFDTHKSLMSQTVSEEMWDILKLRLTEEGDTLRGCMVVGLDRKRPSNIGISALSPACYLVYREAFWPVIEKLHPGFDLIQDTHVNDLDTASILPLCSSMGEQVVNVSITVDRAISGLPFGIALDIDQRRRVEEVAAGALGQTKQTGGYHPVRGSSSFAEAEDPLTDEQLKEFSVFVAGNDCSDDRDFPDARGVFVSQDGQFTCVVNQSEHLSFRTSLPYPDLSSIFLRMAHALAETEAKLKEEYGLSFARLPKLGYVTASPDKIGCAFHAQVVMRLPKMSRRTDLVPLAHARGVKIEKATAPLHPPATAPKGGPPPDHYVISVCPTLGDNEAKAVNVLANAVHFLTRLERQLQMGRKTLWLVDQHPYTCIVGGPVSGKKAVGERVAQSMGLACVNAADLLIEVLAGQGIFTVDEEAAEEAVLCSSMGMPVPGGGEIEERLCEKVVERLLSDECQREGFLLIGFPRNANQLQAMITGGVCPSKLVIIEDTEPNCITKCSAFRTDPIDGSTVNLAGQGGVIDKAYRTRLIKRDKDEPFNVKKRFLSARNGLNAMRKALPPPCQFLSLDGFVDREESLWQKSDAYVREPPMP